MDQTENITPWKQCFKIIKQHADPLDLSVETVWQNKGEIQCACFNISGPRLDRINGWFCFTIVLTLTELKLGLWTRESIKHDKDVFSVIEKDRIFEPIRFDLWLKEWFEKAVLEELTRPLSF